MLGFFSSGKAMVNKNRANHDWHSILEFEIYTQEKQDEAIMTLNHWKTQFNKTNNVCCRDLWVRNRLCAAI